MNNEYFDKMAQGWDDNPARQQLAKAVWEFLESCAIINENISAMDYGCGTGLLSVPLAGKVKTVYALDASAGMLSRLFDKIDERQIKNIRAVRHDAAIDAPLNINLELIVSSMALHHIDDTAAIIKKLSSMLTNAGRLIIADLCTEDGSFHKEVKVPHNGFEPAHIENLMSQNGLEIITSQIICRFHKNGNEYPICAVSAKKP